MPPLEVIAYEHAATLIDRTPWEVSRDPKQLVEAQATCCRRYGSTFAVMGIDVYNLEAEAMGATVAAGAPYEVPAVVEHPLGELHQIAQCSKLEIDQGRLEVTLAAADDLTERMPDVRCAIPLAGPYSVAAGLMGMDMLLCTLAETPETVRDTLFKLLELLEDWHRAVAQSGHHLVIFESGVAPPLMSPAMFETAIHPALARMLSQFAQMADQPPTLIIGGDTLGLVDMLIHLPITGLIAPQETDQATFLEACATQPQVHVRVNMNSRVFLENKFQVIETEYARCRLLAESHPHASIGTGVLPYNANPEAIEMCIRLAASV